MTPTDAARVVQAQLDAYNARDIDAFMACWAADALYYQFPGELMAQGAAAIRARHVARFAEPALFGTLIQRIAVGDIVVDQEVVTRSFPEGVGEVDVVAIYEVARGLISRAWFRMGAPRRLGVPGWRIRPATPDDVAAIRALSRAAYATWVPLIGREPWPMTADYDAAVRRHRIDLLEQDGALAGLVEMILGGADGAELPAGELLIENVAVAPAHQGRGLGRALMAHAEAVAVALGCREVRLYTNQMFAANIALYQRLGYAIDREEVVAVGVVVHMSKGVGNGAR